MHLICLRKETLPFWHAQNQQANLCLWNNIYARCWVIIRMEAAYRSILLLICEQSAYLLWMAGSRDSRAAVATHKRYSGLSLEVTAIYQRMPPWWTITMDRDLVADPHHHKRGEEKKSSWRILWAGGPKYEGKIAPPAVSQIGNRRWPGRPGGTRGAKRCFLEGCSLEKIKYIN